MMRRIELNLLLEDWNNTDSTDLDITTDDEVSHVTTPEIPAIISNIYRLVYAVKLPKN